MFLFLFSYDRRTYFTLIPSQPITMRSNSLQYDLNQQPHAKKYQRVKYSWARAASAVIRLSGSKQRSLWRRSTPPASRCLVTDPKYCRDSIKFGWLAILWRSRSTKKKPILWRSTPFKNVVLYCQKWNIKLPQAVPESLHWEILKAKTLLAKNPPWEYPTTFHMWRKIITPRQCTSSKSKQ